MHRWPSFKREGWEALIDERVPREPKLAKNCGPLIQAARAANPRLTKEEALDLLGQQGIQVLPSFSTIKLHFARADARARYRRRKAPPGEQVVELPLAGGELLMAAELETGGIAALTEEVVALGRKALRTSKGQVPIPDTSRRNEQGQFTARYNRARKRQPGEVVAAYLRPALEKGEQKVPSWPRFVDESRETLDLKLRMLTMGWMVAETSGWDALRAPRVAGLAPLCGFAYLPSTLSKLTSALAQSGAGQRLLQKVGTHWHSVAQARWGEGGAMAALYVDNHIKEMWTSLFTLSGKVSRLNRVMPSITNTFVHTGAGTPLVLSVQSGAAPLAPRLPELVEQANRTLGDEVERAVVIDSEGSTFDLLEAFAKAEKVIITPLKPSRVSELSFEYGRGSYYRPYREHDQLRVGQVTLLHKPSKRSLVVGALRIKRAHRPSDTVLLTTGLQLGMEGRDLADLYYQRWPLQENAFKEGAAVHLNEHRGNCGRMVSNVAVVTELERLAKREGADHQKLRDLVKEGRRLAKTSEQAKHEAAWATERLLVRRRRLEALIERGRVEGKQLGRAAIEQQAALREAEQAERARSQAEQHEQQNKKQQARLNERLVEARQRQEHLEPRRQIRQVDVELDSVLTAMKLTASMLISFVLREYLPVAMSPQTFLSRVLTVQGRKELRPDEERVVLFENPRDPEINAVVQGACEELNRRKLTRDGRRLRFEIAPHG